MVSTDAGRAASRALHRAGWLLHAHVVETKLHALREAVENKYDPNQPRVPAGNSDGGQWTDGDGGTGGRLPRRLGTPLDVGDGEYSLSERVRLAQNDPADQESDVPRLPRKRPRDIKERNRGARVLARFILKQIRKEKLGRLIGPILDALETADWLRYDYSEPLQTYIDPPKTLGELQRAVFSPRPGTQVHHVVEQTPAAQEGYPRSAIDASDNLVRIPTFKHEEISAWYSRANSRFGSLTPRDYLRGKSWNERRRVGIDALIEFEVLRSDDVEP
jgi:hypothetical protein